MESLVSALILTLSAVLLGNLWVNGRKMFNDDYAALMATLDRIETEMNKKKVETKDQGEGTKPYGIVSSQKAYMCSNCKAIFIDTDDTIRCPICERRFDSMFTKRIPISIARYKWLYYWRTRK